MKRANARAVLLVAAGLLATLAIIRGAEPSRLRVAAISFVPTKLDVESNAARLEAAFRRAAAGGAKLAVGPEGVLEGYIVNEIIAGQMPAEKMRAVALPIDHPIIRRFQTLAQELKLCLVFGFAERIGDEVFNTAVFIDSAGAIRGTYHKMQLAEGCHPDWWFNRLGTASRTFETPFGRCGVLICNDRWNPALAKIPALDGAQFLVIPSYGSNSPSQDEAVIARSRETGLPIVEANVGVTLVVSEGQAVSVSREKETVTFGEIMIPPPLARQPAERDATEREFLAWRETEMARRYDARMEKVRAQKNSPPQNPSSKE